MDVADLDAYVRMHAFLSLEGPSPGRIVSASTVCLRVSCSVSAHDWQVTSMMCAGTHELLSFQ